MPKKKVPNLQPGDFRTPADRTSPLMTPSDAAKRLGVSTAVVRGWVDKGLLRPRVVAKDGRYHFTEQQIFAYRHDKEVRKVMRDVYLVEAWRYVHGNKLKPIKRPPIKEPVPEFMPSSLAARLLCVSVGRLSLWRRRKAFPPLVTLPTGQARYSKFQIMTFSPEAVRRAVDEELRKTAPGRVRQMRRTQKAFDAMWNASPILRELYPRKGTTEPPFTH